MWCAVCRMSRKRMTMKMRTTTSERSQDGTALRLALHCLAE